MDKHSALTLVDETLGACFDEKRFAKFASNLLKKLEPKPFLGLHKVRTGSLIYEPYRGFIESFSRIGKYTDPEGKTLDVLVAHLCPGVTSNTARTRQRSFIAWYLENGRNDGSQRDAALVAFVPHDSTEWRFSLIRMEYELTRSAAGKIKGAKRFSPARRFSFLVGESENTHTARARFINILLDDRAAPSLEDLSRAFSVETITDEFFETYRELLGRVERQLIEVAQRDKIVRDELSKCDIEPVEFAKKLLGQIVFLYFIQKKGWLGVEKDQKWGTGPKAFLRRLFDGQVVKYENFFNDVLEPLFYDMLAQDKGELSWRSYFKCRIPFLNGGLFEPLYGYDWENTDITLPNELFSNRRREADFDSGDGILDIFDRYNFTVKEDEPLEKEVAIDPELLGKVFENLLEDKDRKSKGSYYTPREVVHYMCQESLVSHIQSQLSAIPREDISGFIKYGEANVYNDAKVAKEGKETDRYHYKTPLAIRQHAADIDRLLAEIKVCDPAVGSGAFPMGVINEIVRARWSLNPLLFPGQTEDIKGRTQYDFKWHAIENSIYGVDLDPGAIEITKLRLWLSLVVDEESLDKIQPLPNLDFKIMQGNSLLDEFKGKKLFDDRMFGVKDPLDGERDKLNRKLSELQRAYATLTREDPTKLKKSDLPARIEEVALRLKRLKKSAPLSSFQPMSLFQQKSTATLKLEELHSLHQRFFRAWHKTEKERLRKQIDETEWDLIELSLREQDEPDTLEELKRARTKHGKPFFLWRLNFHDVFETKGGFDVVLANPPYVRQEKLSTEDQESFARNFEEVHKGTADILVYFYALAIRLLHDEGSLAFITSNKYMRAGYGDRLREHLCKSIRISRVIDFADLPVFEVIAYPAVLLGSKTDVSPSAECSVVDLGLPITRLIRSRNASVTTKEVREELRNLESLITEHGSHGFPQLLLRKEGWVLEDPKLLSLFQRLRTVGKPLGEFVQGRMYRGVLTGLNEAFVIDKARREALIQADPKSDELIKPWLRGKDVKRWRAEWAGLYVIFTRRGTNIEKYPAIQSHLEQWRKELTPKKSTDQKGPGRKPGAYQWYDIQDNIAYFEEFNEPKIIFATIASEPRFLFDTDNFFTNQKCYIIAGAPAWSVPVFNSRLFHVLASATTLASRQNGFYEWEKKYMWELPVAIPSIEGQERLEQLEGILRKCSSNQTEDEIEDIICEAYQVTDSERRLINQWYECHRVHQRKDADEDGID